MPGSYRNRARQFHLTAISACAAAVIAALPAPASAQNLLESLFNALGGRTASAPLSAERADPNAWDFIDRAAAPAGPKTSYCVRLCDGRHFPLPRKAGAVKMSSAQICSAMCPAAETRVFNGSAIEHAVADDGKPYSSIKNAFLYRDKTVAGCTCTKGGAGGLASMDVKDDPTLRRGDIVVMREGPMVFTGARRGADREQAFVHPEDYRGLPQNVRRELAAMQIAQQPNESASLPANAMPARNTVAVSYAPPRERVAPVEITPVAEAFASFIQ